ncbi:MAG: hypothetical protein HY791_21060 [Deltaproteobacteria bacterium]|nr:hypothetical protein [Deltaproteobacteria bacterium]
MRSTTDRIALLALLASACGSMPKSATPPAWFTKPPDSADTLYFVGDATQQPDEELARDTALQKALHHLLVYCGARIESEFKSLEVEKDGKYEQSTELGVSVHGEEIEVQQTKLRLWQVEAGGDGYAGYALVAWPKAEYERVLLSKSEQAKRALERYLAAEAEFAGRDLDAASGSLTDASRFLGKSKAVVSIGHDTIKDTRMLRVAIESLEKRIAELDGARRSVLALDVVCRSDAKPVPCDVRRAGALRQAVAQGGKKVSPSSIPAELVSGILDARINGRAGLPKDAGFVVAVEYVTEFREKDQYGFQYVNYSARAAVLDVRTAQVVHTKSIPPTKVGHVKLQGAIEKGLNEAEKLLAADLKSMIGALE